MYVKRDDRGRICGISECADAGCEEHLEDDDSELQAFLKQHLATEEALKESDTDLVRVVEDLIDLLTEKRVIQFTELPRAAQQKLMRRQSLRQQHNSLKLLSDEGEDDSFPML